MASLETSALTCADDLGEWDQFVDESPQGCIFCRSWWLQAVAPDSFEILILRRAGRIIAGMPMVMRRRFGCLFIGMPKLTQTLGVLLAPSHKPTYEGRLSEEMAILREVVQALPRCEYFGVNFHHSFANWLPFYWAGYSQTTRYTYRLLDLDNHLWSQLQSGTRTKIRKGEKNGLRVQVDDDIDRLWELTSLTFARQRKPIDLSRPLLERLDERCRSRDAGKALCAVDPQGRVHAAMYVVWEPRAAYYLIGGADPGLRSSGAQYWLMWEAIVGLCNKTQTFDFEGSMMPFVERVFRSFGAVQTPYFQISKGSLPAKAALTLRRAVKGALPRPGPWR